MKKVLLILAVMMVVATVQAADGVKIISKTKSLTDGAVSNTIIYMTDTKVAIENKGAKDNSSFVFDSGKEAFTYIDHRKKEYYHFDKATMQQLKQQIQMMVMMMKQFAANMPPEQKKKLDRIINNDASAMEFKPTGSSEKVGKWSAKKYEGINDGTKATDMYIASFKTIGRSKDEFQVMEKMIAYFKANLSEIAAFLPSGGSFSQIGFDDSSPVFKEGVPVKTIAYKDGKANNENVVENIVATSISDALFAAPSGYTSKQIKMQ